MARAGVLVGEKTLSEFADIGGAGGCPLYDPRRVMTRFDIAKDGEPFALY
jgi:hypothetical protein